MEQLPEFLKLEIIVDLVIMIVTISCVLHHRKDNNNK